jgi:hypothetical protein
MVAMVYWHAFRAVNAKVLGSEPGGHPNKFGELPERSIGAVSKTDGPSGHEGSNPSLSASHALVGEQANPPRSERGACKRSDSSTLSEGTNHGDRTSVQRRLASSAGPERYRGSPPMTLQA